MSSFAKTQARTSARVLAITWLTEYRFRGFQFWFRRPRHAKNYHYSTDNLKEPNHVGLEPQTKTK
jgi:hypothetical protein